MLSDQVREKCIGLRENPMGFEGLIAAGDASCLASGAVIENPSLDEIVVYHTMGRKQ